MAITQKQREICRFINENRQSLDDLIDETAHDLRERAVNIEQDAKGYHFSKPRIGGNLGITIHESDKALFHTHPPEDKYHAAIPKGFSPRDLLGALHVEAEVFCLGEKVNGQNVITCKMLDSERMTKVFNGPRKEWELEDLFDAISEDCPCKRANNKK